MIVASGAAAYTRLPQQTGRTLSGYILTQQNELLPNVNVIIRSDTGELLTLSDDKGEFRLAIPSGPLTLIFEANNIGRLEQKLDAADSTENLRIRVTVVIAPIQEIPLDLVSAGDLDRFGFIDPFNGGRVRTGIFSGYYKRELESGGILKVDGFLGRTLFDLFSNFTFFLNDPVFGDEIQQHDSRLQEGLSVQYLRPQKIFGNTALFTAGANLLAAQVNVGLFHSVERNPNRLDLNRAQGIDNPGVLLTNAHAKVTNVAGFFQQSIDLLRGRLHLEGGLRYDYFRFNVRDGVNVTPADANAFSGTQSSARLQPKASVAFTVSDRLPLSVYVNYGRGINSQDARGVIQQPDNPRIATTDFYQASIAYNERKFSLSADYFLIDHSNEQVYIPDDGTFEFKGPSRVTGNEVKGSAHLNRYLSMNGGLTQVTNAFFRGTDPRRYVDSSPHFVAAPSLKQPTGGSSPKMMAVSSEMPSAKKSTVP